MYKNAGIEGFDFMDNARIVNEMKGKQKKKLNLKRKRIFSDVAKGASNVGSSF